MKTIKKSCDQGLRYYGGVEKGGVKVTGRERKGSKACVYHPIIIWFSSCCHTTGSASENKNLMKSTVIRDWGGVECNGIRISDKESKGHKGSLRNPWIIQLKSVVISQVMHVIFNGNIEKCGD